MSLTDALLIIVILLIAYWIAAEACGLMKPADKPAVVVEPAKVPADAVKINETAEAAEASAAKENMEYFESQCDIQKQLGPSVDACDCPADASFSYAKAEYGPASDYTTWIMNDTIDPTVAANHREFIADRTGENSSVNVIGRTYTPEDSHQSYTPPNQWIGIRGRPSLVPVCSPDQVADVNYGYYPQKQKLNWDTTSTYTV